MNSVEAYKDFIHRFRLLITKHPDLILTTLSNIFTMRLIGNKTHGDLAEVAIAEFINQYMYDFRSVHVGKDLYRAKTQEEDITVINELTQAEFPVSLKAYGDGPLQLSTDKNFRMFPRLQREGDEIADRRVIQRVLQDSAFSEFRHINVLPLIYDERQQRCNILVFDYERALAETARIILEADARSRRHPVYRFYNAQGGYICEVRYGDAAANALQRGLWTHTRKASAYFESLTNGWVSYSHNIVLVELFSRALVASQSGHERALHVLNDDIRRMKRESGVSR